MAGRGGLVVSVYDAAELEGWFRSRRRNPSEARRVRHAFLKRGLTPAEALAALPAEVAPAADEAIRFHPLTLRERVEAGDGATKLLLETAGGDLVEAVVLRIASGRTTLCVSSQAGCAARCSFCATGAGGLRANLSTAEILDQLTHANRLLRAEGRRVRNVVFMGMGEPLHNLDAVAGAVAELTGPAGYALSPAHVLVSTVGVPDALVRLARRFPRLGLALSLHSARPEQRRALIPLTVKHTLPALRAALEEVQALNPRGVMVEVLMLHEQTDTPADLEALLGFLSGLQAHVNLIPFNAVSHAPELRPSSPERIRAFAAALRAAGFRVTTRRSLGGSVAGACGQLASYAGGGTPWPSSR
ncbi:MAG: radical SAM protein [Planctomycetes bacterium]|nr:radical SAM protein [Planctomycetota bacterium]